MKVELANNGLIIVPETEFELQFLNSKFSDKNIKAFVKTGIDTRDVVGLKISVSEKASDDEEDETSCTSEGE